MTSAPPRMTDEQAQVVSSWGQGQAVQAGAGCGKTTTLVTKCEKLIERKPKARFVAVSFTEKSANDLREKLSQRLPLGSTGCALQGHWVMTIHGLCGAVIREFGQEAGLDGEEVILSEMQARVLWERVLEQLWLGDLTSSPEVNGALERLLERETRESLQDLLVRMKGLRSFPGFDEKLSETHDSDLISLGVLSRYVFDRYQESKRRQGGLDFNDLEKYALQILRIPQVQKIYHDRFELFLVDEFQDTNPLQAEIVSLFARPGFTNLCVVGDPKQSIYRFRDADVSVFQEFCSAMPVQQKLSWNFRSRPEIVEYVNEACAPLFEADESSHRADYGALVPKRESVPTSGRVLEVQVKSASELASWIQSQVNEGVPLGQMALLLRKVRGNEHWLQGLQAAGIPLVVGSGGLYWEEPRNRELLALLRWWENPGNLYSAGVFLRAPWVGIADGVLDEWLRSEKSESLWDQFLATDNPVAQTLASFKEREGIRPGEVLLALNEIPEVEEKVGIFILGLWHRCEEFSLSGMGFRQVVEELSFQMEEKQRERELPPPKGRGLLQVLTIHGSKGLEFDRVLLVDFPAKKNRAAPAPLLFWDRKKGLFLGKRDEAGGRDREHEEEVPWRKGELQQSLAESKRLFYVALTRAREELHLVTLGDEEVLSGEFGSDFWRSWIQAKGLKKIQMSEGPAVSTLPHERKPISHLKPVRFSREVRFFRPRHSVTELNLLSVCARQYDWTKVHTRVQLEPFQFSSRENDAEEESLSTRELGTEVHSCLEHQDWFRLKHLEEVVGSERLPAAAVIEWAKQSEWMQSAPGTRSWTERSFEVSLDGAAIVGSIDRLVQTGSLYRVIDFKVTEKDKSPEELIQRYSGQMRTYEWAVSRMVQDPSITLQSCLVHISGGGVKEIPLPPISIASIENDLRKRIESSRQILNSQQEAVPSPGNHCKNCPFLSECNEGRSQNNS